MTNEEALEVAQLVAKLWPSPAMDGVRCTFYARALTVIPEHVGAINAVSELFVDERFQPTPGQVIDRALCGSTSAGAIAWESLLARATEIHAGRPVASLLDVATMDALRSAGMSVGHIAKALDQHRTLDNLRTRFLTGYRDSMRDAAAGKLGATETRELTT
jgi:hypothetical protein